MTNLRKSPRLPAASYIGPLAAHLTFVTRQSEPIFLCSHVSEACKEALYDASDNFGASLHAYCVMPDHLHVLVGIPEGVSLLDFAHRFKQVSGFRMEKITGASVWQVSYYDHILRDDEGITATAQYIWQNPVTAGLAMDWRDYKFSGPAEAIKDAID